MGGRTKPKDAVEVAERLRGALRTLLLALAGPTDADAPQLGDSVLKARAALQDADYLAGQD